MKYLKLVFVGGMVALTTLPQPASAGQPPDVVASDAGWNTAMGTGALANAVTGPAGLVAVENTASGAFALNGNTTGTANSGFGYWALINNTTGSWNTASGDIALYNNTTGQLNTASGYAALNNNVTGNSNSAFGTEALYSNLASFNTAFGAEALYYNTTGYNNSALGSFALGGNTTGYSNTAIGYGALAGNTTGFGNTSAGNSSLAQNTTGQGDSAFGNNALYYNTTGANNTAFGFNALYTNTTGKGNAAQGTNALYSNTTGIRNLGIGNNALYDNASGSYNIAVGFDAGFNVTTGSNNIEIGASGTPSDNGTIQIGVQGTQTRTTIAGIYGSPLTGSAVYVTANGQLGVQASSGRFKTDIAPMPDNTSKLAQLRPVIFHYKTDPTGTRQYGLIAEEVDQIYPELVIRDNAGKIQGVHYEELAPMLLSEIQRQQRINAGQAEQIAALNARADHADAQAAEIADLKRLMVAMQAGLLELKATENRVARR